MCVCVCVCVCVCDIQTERERDSSVKTVLAASQCCVCSHSSLAGRSCYRTFIHLRHCPVLAAFVVADTNRSTFFPVQSPQVPPDFHGISVS